MRWVQESEIHTNPKETWYQMNLQIEGKQTEVAFHVRGVRGHQIKKMTEKADDMDEDAYEK